MVSDGTVPPGHSNESDIGASAIPKHNAEEYPTQPIEIRAVRPGDVPALRRMGNIHRCDQPEAQLTPYSPLRSALSVPTPWSGPRRRFFVACRGGQVVGFVQFQPMPPDQRWLLVGLGLMPRAGEAQPIWEELLRHGVIAAGQRGVKRLYARSPRQSPVEEAVRALAFVSYASETVFVAHDLPVRHRPRGLRPQEQADTWAIHQLYNAAVPRQVQYAEAYTSHRWDVPGRRGEQARERVLGWLIEEGHHVIGYARTTTRGDAHVVELVYHPDRVEVVSDLIDGALTHLAERPASRVYCAVRGYQAEAATALEAAGFDAILEQDLHIKYTTATVRAPAIETAPLHVDVRDRLPKRVPTFLHGPPRDESAT